MAKHILVTGEVHGVGFRPFVYGLATRLDLHGWICNTPGGVEIYVEGCPSGVESFLEKIITEKPSQVRIDSLEIRSEESRLKYKTFDILPSLGPDDLQLPIKADLAICPDCERELFDPRDRRYLYPFISCTHCGPRYSIIQGVPYDRSDTTMAEFGLCDDCSAEYTDPLDRRFHAHSTACSDCGPFVALREIHSQWPNASLKISSIECRTSAILKARRLLREGYILGIKGLGGFQLACDASNSLTVEDLRDRKGRIDKPFALMASDLEVIRSICSLSREEEELLTSHEKPIVLLEKKFHKGQEFSVSRWVAPNIDTLGVMLPYTPLHHLLLNQTDLLLATEPAPRLLVMTSGSLANEPIATQDEDALLRLSPLADAFILHNREIHLRSDDSIVRVDPGMVGRNDHHSQSSPAVYLRRSRGYAPYAVRLACEVKPTLAVGSEFKNAFCLARDRQAFLSPFIGSMENVQTYESFEQSVGHLSNAFNVRPEIVAHDLNPDYFSTQYVRRSTFTARRVAVQHQHAHIASCMADHNLDDRRLIGLCFDGTGYGTDGAFWGGEVLLASYSSFERFAHLEYLP
ncbi:MAG: carbamoyltransferase HypF, partial [Bacteroidota bacterium]